MSQAQTGTCSTLPFPRRVSIDAHKIRNGNRTVLIVDSFKLPNSRSVANFSDALRPCSTCVRSHAHALSHAPAGVIVPERPECTFDEGIFYRFITRLSPSIFHPVNST